MNDVAGWVLLVREEGNLKENIQYKEWLTVV